MPRGLPAKRPSARLEDRPNKENRGDGVWAASREPEPIIRGSYGRPGRTMHASSMTSPLERARNQLDTWCAARARAELARGDQDLQLREERARAELRTGALREAMDEADRLGLLAAEEHGAMLDLLSLAARDEVFARAGVSPLRVTDFITLEGLRHSVLEWASLALESTLPPVRARAIRALAHADDRLRAQRVEAIEEARALASKVRDRGPRSKDSSPDDEAEEAARFLAATEETARELMARLARSRAVERPRTVPEAFALLRHAAEHWRASPRDRARRVASILAPLGLMDELARRTKLGSPHRDLDIAARVVAINPPHQVAIRPSPLELGLPSELALAHGIGRALAISLTSPGLPPALRRSWPGSLGRGLGELLTGLYANPIFLQRAHGLSGAELEGVRDSSLAFVLFRARMLAARMGAREGLEEGREQLARAFALNDLAMPDALAEPSSLRVDERSADFRAAIVAPSIALALRDCFDEDWFRNPRAREPIFAASARGGGLSIEAWAEELGARSMRSIEWYATQ